jgi:DtxR family Mn-dependent transcriptional regulator
VTRGHSVDEYLEAVYFLVSPIGEYRPDEGTTAIASRVAELLGVSRAAVGEMLKRMEADGLLERGQSREVRLTPRGAERAEAVVRRHRIIERLLTDYLGYSAAEAHEHADQLGGTFSDDMVERIHERLGFPERCPHGWPVAPAAEREENRLLTTLAELATGEDCEIVRLAEHDGDLLQWFYDEGLTPGTALEVRDVRPAAGHRKVWVASAEGGGEGERVVADKAARCLLVRRVDE